jgi:peroxiredoxin
VPHPTTVIIDRQGVIRYLRVDIDYKVRPSVAELLEALDQLGQ